MVEGGTKKDFKNLPGAISQSLKMNQVLETQSSPK